MSFVDLRLRVAPFQQCGKDQLMVICQSFFDLVLPVWDDEIKGLTIDDLFMVHGCANINLVCAPTPGYIYWPAVLKRPQPKLVFLNWCKFTASPPQQ